MCSQSTLSTLTTRLLCLPSAANGMNIVMRGQESGCLVYSPACLIRW